MRLLNVKTLRLEEFHESVAPPYAILSHTWGDGEVSFQDIQDASDNCRKKPGYKKIRRTCQQAGKENFQYVWIDTCCIDKTSSAELSEAINSMFRWYENAAICYAFLADVPNVPLRRSRWFTRGWTLQELLAPQKVAFFDSDWLFIGTRADLSEQISGATAIDRDYLYHGEVRRLEYVNSGDDALRPGQHQALSIHGASIATRMSWASSRETTRPEDMAYSLLGLFGIHMPLIYGEGSRAFFRLQEEIMKHSTDHSIFAWKYTMPTHEFTRIVSENGFLAHSPIAFRGCETIISVPLDTRSALFSVTNQGVQIRLPISKGSKAYALLQCQHKNDPTTVLGIPVRQVREGLYEREPGNPIAIDHRTWERWSNKEVFLSLREQSEQRPTIYPDSTIYLRHIPEFVSVQHHSGPLSNKSSCVMEEQIFFLGLWDATHNLALRCRLVELRGFFIPMKIETCLISVPEEVDHSLSERLKYVQSAEETSSSAFFGDLALFSTVHTQNIGGKPLYILDIICLSKRRPILRFNQQQKSFDRILPITRAVGVTSPSGFSMAVVSIIQVVVAFLLQSLHLYPDLLNSLTMEGTGLLVASGIIFVAFADTENMLRLDRIRIGGFSCFLLLNYTKTGKVVWAIFCVIFLSIAFLKRYWNWRKTHVYRDMTVTAFLAEVTFSDLPTGRLPASLSGGYDDILVYTLDSLARQTDLVMILFAMISTRILID